MTNKGFNYLKADAQSTDVKAVKPNDFDFDSYSEYELSLNDKCKEFLKADSGVLVYRRMRVSEVFSYGCRDMEKSLEWQLGALEKSKLFKADIPNFLEPWYGIGTTSSAWDIDYYWSEAQAPAVRHKFQTVEQALAFPYMAVEKTNIGRHTLDMIEYFLDKTKGRLPVSFCDIQSPLNVAPNIVETSNFMMELMLNPEAVMSFLDIIADQIIHFSKIQESMIGDCLVSPGHGFASHRIFEGIGLSEDNIVMISGDQYEDHVIPSVFKIGKEFGGSVFHSCGNYSDKLNSVKKIGNLKMIDAAFSEQTDPDPNPPGFFSEALNGTGIILNARIVGDLNTIEKVVSELWKPKMKLIVVTYCETPEEQEKAYELIHEICS